MDETVSSIYEVPCTKESILGKVKPLVAKVAFRAGATPSREERLTKFPHQWLNDYRDPQEELE